MNRRLGLALAAGLIVTAPCGATAQTARTADGITAFVRGDYARAVEILKPAAERWQMPFDNTAAFFMAMMYDNGLGIAPDPVRACALILRTTVHGASLSRALTFAAQTLATEFNPRLAPEQMHRCMFLADNGFDGGFEPVTFTLAPGHWIKLEASPVRPQVTAHIEYAGRQTEVEVRVPVMAGVRHLPFSVTELTSQRAAPTQRHFLEAFAWIPAHVNQWTLMWFVFEIVRDTLVDVTFEELRIVDGERPPDYQTADLRRLATVRVNADGDAEWAVLSGAEARTDVIETDAERQEVAAERLARQAAEKEVDWALRRQPDRTPSLAYSASSSEGVWDPLCTSSSRDRTEGIMLHLGPQAFEGASPSTLAIGQTPGFEMRVHVYDAPQRRFPFCSDVRMRGDEGEVWRAVAGTATIEPSPVFRIREPETYRAMIRVIGAEFVSATGARVRQSQPITLSAIVRLPQR